MLMKMVGLGGAGRTAVERVALAAAARKVRRDGRHGRGITIAWMGCRGRMRRGGRRAMGRLVRIRRRLESGLVRIGRGRRRRRVVGVECLVNRGGSFGNWHRRSSPTVRVCKQWSGQLTLDTFSIAPVMGFDSQSASCATPDSSSGRFRSSGLRLVCA